MSSDQYEEEVAEVLKELWEKGVRALNWSATPASFSEPWAESWADVYIEEVCGVMEENWLVTIVSPNDKTPEGNGALKVKHDSELVFLFEDPGQLAATQKFFTGLDGCSTEIDVDLVEGESGEFYWERYRSDFFRDRAADILTARVPVWSIDLIERVVGAWLKKISGHEFALQFNPKSEPGIFAEISQTLEDIKSGRVETFDLGDGLYASPQAFDAFLDDPDIAAEITADLKKNIIKKDE